MSPTDPPPLTPRSPLEGRADLLNAWYPGYPLDPDQPTRLAPTSFERRLEEAVPEGVMSRATDRLAHAHDASHYRLVPESVVAPRTTEEVAALLRLSVETARPLTFRSGGTSLSGQASSSSVLVDTRRHFRQIEVLDDGRRVRVQPGATVRAVNARLARFGRKLGPDPASEVACTIGGVIANNSSGMLCGTHANTYRTLESSVLVLPNGLVLDTGAPDAQDTLRRGDTHLYDGLLELRDRVRGNSASTSTIQRLFALKNTMGYSLNSFVDFDDPIAILEHLVVGSEGTLAFVAEATFQTVVAHPHVATALLVFPSLSDATTALPLIVEAGFDTVELLDAASLLVAQLDPTADESLRALQIGRHAAFLVELHRPTGLDLDEATAAAHRLFDELPLITTTRVTGDPSRRAALWRTRKGIYTAVAGHRPAGTTALLEDIAVPVPSLLATCDSLVELFDEHGYEGSVIFGHAKDGNIHFMLNEQFDRPELLDRYLAFTEDMVDLVLSHGGTLKAEHGTGRAMAPYVRRQYGDELYDVMRRTKDLIDPVGILNPGVLLDDDPRSHARNLKTSPTVEPEVDRCVDCGYCEPVCPSRDLTTTPRQRIALRRELARAEAEGDNDLVDQLREEYKYDGIDTCAADGMCQTACPVLINTGDLVRRLRSDEAGTVDKKIWSRAADSWGSTTRRAARGLDLAAGMPRAAAAAARAARAVLGAERVPQWTPDLPGGGTPRRAHTSDKPAAIYFPACVTAMFGPAGGEGHLGARVAFETLCERAGIQLRTPDDINDLCCGTPWKSKGLTDGYARMKSAVLPRLKEADPGGTIPLVCDASSCTEGLSVMQRAEGSLTNPAIDVLQFVHEVVLPRLPVPQRMSRVVVHPTCSTTHLGSTDALLELARTVADDVFVPPSWGCCAFAGDRGLLHPELTRSATAAQAAEVRLVEADAHVSCNRTCELAMTRATGRDYRHVLELLEEGTR